MVRTVAESEFVNAVDDFLTDVERRKEQIVIARQGEPIAILSPLPIRRVFLDEVGLQLSDLDMPGDGFAEDLEEILHNQKKLEVRDWPS